VVRCRLASQGRAPADEMLDAARSQFGPIHREGVGEPNVGIVEKFRFLKVPLNNARGREGGGGGGGVGGGGERTRAFWLLQLDWRQWPSLTTRAIAAHPRVRAHPLVPSLVVAAGCENKQPRPTKTAPAQGMAGAAQPRGPNQLPRHQTTSPNSLRFMRYEVHRYTTPDTCIWACSL
jgi:hypothetical protein